MPRTIPDEEYTFLQGRRQIADFVESIYNDPQLTKEAKALIKKKYPKWQIPDYDIEERLEQRLAAEKKERDDREVRTTQSSTTTRVRQSAQEDARALRLHRQGNGRP